MREAIVMHELKAFEKLRSDRFDLNFWVAPIKSLLQVTMNQVFHSDIDGMVVLVPTKRLHEAMYILFPMSSEHMYMIGKRCYCDDITCLGLRELCDRF